MITQKFKGVTVKTYFCAACGALVKFETDYALIKEQLCTVCKVKKNLKVKS